MAGRVAGKNILVTAAGQGMGRESAIALSCEGARVTATDIREDLLADLSDEAVKRGGSPITVARLDVTKLIDGMAPLDVLFNCAGYVHQGTILEASDEDLMFSFALNVQSMMRTIKTALPRMLDNGGGSIINMASVCSSVKGIPNRFVYGTTKAAVIGLTKSVAADYVGRGIRCNAIGPGTVDTPSLADRMRELGDIDEARKMFTARQPMGRLALSADIIPMVVYLASDESAFATGQIFTIDGGITI